MTKFFSAIAGIFLFLFLSFMASASQNPPLPLAEYFTQSWDTRDGLPHNGISALSQSEDGYIWAATWEGLARFNGREFKIFTRGSEAGLPDSGVKSLHVAKNGRLLVAGARGGLSERVNRQWRSLKATSTLVNSAIYDNNKGYWFGLEEQGLIYREQSEDMRIINDITVYQVVQAPSGEVWVASNKGLFQVKNRTEVTRYGQASGLIDKPVFSVLITHDNQLIIGTELGAYRYENERFEPLHPRLMTEAISVLLQDSNNDIWLGSTNHGVFRYSELGVEKLDESTGLPNSRIFSLFEDQEHSIWVGTSSGLFRLRKAPFITMTNRQGLAGNYVRSVFSHSDGSLWVGSSKGLNRIDQGKVHAVQLPTGITDVSVLSLAEGADGEVLVGSYTQGVFEVVEQQLQPVNAINQLLPSLEVRSLLVDKHQNTWVGTTAGAVRISATGEAEYFSQQSGLPANFIMALAEDSLGNIWIGTGVGVAAYAEGALNVYRLNDVFNAEYAFGFFAEQDAVWMATDRGILRFNLFDQSFSAITRRNGLPIDKFFQVIIDGQGAMWLTSNRGVLKISAAELNKFLLNENAILDYQRFTEDSGLLSSQANGGSTPAATLHHDGSIWVATAKGASQMAYQRLNSISQQKIPVVIEKFIADGVSYPVIRDKTFVLSPGSSHLAIYYAGLGFLNSKNIQYQTRLLGFDDYWQDKGNQTYTEFTNLAPGRYEFNMRAKYPDGQWREQQAKLTFEVKPYYWQTIGFRVAVVALFFFLLYLAYRFRLTQIQRNEEKLQRLVEQQTIKLREQAKQFAYQASHDQLTGLHNRRAFDSWCESDFKQARLHKNALSIAILDIDHFKRVNDQFSHLVGDQILKIVAKLMVEQCTTIDANIKLARWGGEEFTLLISRDKQVAREFCQALCDRVRDYDFTSIAADLTVTVSIGVCDNDDILDYEKMISFADKALYCAKFNGRNQVKVYDQQSEKEYTQRTAELKNRRKYD